MKILITAPSLDETRNVSGISTIVRQIMDYGPDEYSHFVAGREDGERSGAKWAIRQALLPANFFLRIMRFRPDVIHINTALTDRSIIRDAALVTAAKLTGRPIAVAIHGGKYLIEDFTSTRLFEITGGMLKKANTIIVYSEYEKALISKKWPGRVISTLPNAIPAEFIGNADRENEEPLLVYFGRMHESKGLHELIEASRALRDAGFKFRLDAYGEGPIREFFVSEMTNAIGDRFNYGGVITGSDKWLILRQADIFVLPSRYGEGLPMAMLEAMAAGCIVVAGDVASVSTVVRDSQNGYLVKPNDAAGLASKLKLILGERFEWTGIREKAVTTIRTKFEIKDYMARLGAIYSKTVGE